MVPASMEPETRLLITLRFLATGERFSQLSFGFRTSDSAISQIVSETLKAIYLVLRDDFLKMPQNSNEWRIVADEFERKWNFPHCLGAIDGKHIAIRYKKEYGSYFFNYKGFHSVILLAIVDANYKFLYVNVGTNGRANDAAAFNESSFLEGLKKNAFNIPPDSKLPGTNETVPFVFVADDAFKLTSRILKPHGQRSSDYHKIFNYRLSRARRVVENAFGILANRFQIFQRNIDLPLDKIENLTLAACALHNFITTRDGFESIHLDLEDTNTINLIEGSWRNEVALTSLQRSLANHSAVEGRTVREIYTKYFNTTGSVPWQLSAIKKFNF
ncbi:putative nuclease HARBI1 [Rhagoletis pomonella]|uniref:putative nuclease HARBI1 n=1 Tax=Rhagoletis pomonella TaxID=28610 RepID=UPI001781CB3C|nr:putative nuclease HARBI1 [Rhagoletis pomonella]